MVAVAAVAAVAAAVVASGADGWREREGSPPLNIFLRLGYIFSCHQQWQSGKERTGGGDDDADAWLGHGI